ncbi:MAG TPA: PSD1 and planctomycete cytochrome C domain-containing protein [Tepidisphaeraceae bacterium]|nr:PSD1 and planctomycete cytochrome C domain-containing protein [Tepidisphaeraceae bacterium]
MEKRALLISAGVVVLWCARTLLAAEPAPPPPRPTERDAPKAAPAPPPLPPPAAHVEFFEAKIRPILAERCYACHSASTPKLKGGLRLDVREGVLQGGESGSPAVVGGKLDESPLITAVRYEEESLRMPPKEKLPAEQIALLEQWVQMGAPYPAPATPTTGPAVKRSGMTIAEGKKFWSFAPPREQPVPEARPGGWAKTEIDRFVLAKLAEKNLSPAPAAAKRTLIRRATYDLTGLPPSAEEVEAFVNDASPSAFPKVIDRLLASPRYGERWGRYWLDIARYADTKGYVFEEERRFAFSYTYRDWVVRALNEDLPYDQFLIQQIAADRLELNDDKRPLAALGFLTLGRRFLNNAADINDDRIDVVTRGTMALTVSCARCHDHKYDPIPTADYYSLYGVFASSREPAELPLIGGEKPKQAAEFEAELAKRRAALDDFTQARHAEIGASLREPKQIAKYLLEAQKKITPVPVSPESEVPDVAPGLNPWMTRRWEARLKAAAEANDGVFAVWRRLAAIPHDQFEAKAPAAIEVSLRAAPGENPHIARLVLGGARPKDLRDVADRYGAALPSFDAPDPHADPQAEAVRQVLDGADSPTRVALSDARFVLGNVDRMKRRGLRQKIDELTATHPGSPQRAMALEDAPKPVTPHVFKRGNAANIGEQVPRQFLAVLSPDDRKPFTYGSGRLELAKLIASKDNPLTARVMVNRAWQYHFGHGIVRTPHDFGTRGDPPTHPELLDWLAQRFANDDAWSLKKLHKRIMLSAAYQQSSHDANPNASAVDPENRLLWRQNPRRLDFEAMRDSLLFASGYLDLTMGGRSVDITTEPFTGRRTVYGFIDRQNLPGLFRTFDFASPDATSGMRFTTTVPQQALFMMNSPFVLQQAKRLAARAEVKAEADPPRRVARLYRAVLGRAPTAEEVELAVGFIKAEEAHAAGVVAAAAAATAGKSPWQYGTAVFGATDRVVGFQPLPHWTGSAWQGGGKLPDPKLGWATLDASGGHPGNAPQHAVVRRWTAPRDCTVAIDGKLAHAPSEGDGVRGRLVSSREGLLASWIVHRKFADTRVSQVALKQGDTIDFVVDAGPRGDYSFDTFAWTVKITKEAAANAVAGDDAGGSWDSAAEFTGPAARPSAPLTPWEKYAQVLLQSNEFAFLE